VNITIGAGIFRLPADMAGTLGATAPIAYVLCAIAMSLIVLCLAEAGSRVAATGGPYAYVEVAFGPFVGFLAGFLLWMLLTFAMAAVATVLAANIGALIPALASPGASAVVLITIYAVFAVVNILGVERGSRVNTALTIAKILPLLILIAGGLFAIDSRNLAIVDPPDMPTLARSSILLIFAFAGIEAALVPGGEVKDPARTVPRAIFIAMAAITLLYAGLQFVAQGVLGSTLAASKAAPLAEAAGVALGGWARTLLIVGAVISMLGHAGAMILATPRTLFAFARDGFLPAALARVHPEHRSPFVAILLQCAIVLVLAITSTFEQLAILANLSTLTLYGTCCLATWQLRRRDVRAGGTPF
jgi:APA family basic amino acid/polyamine antiporter